MKRTPEAETARSLLVLCVYSNHLENVFQRQRPCPLVSKAYFLYFEILGIIMQKKTTFKEAGVLAQRREITLSSRLPCTEHQVLRCLPTNSTGTACGSYMLEIKTIYLQEKYF